MTEPMQPQTPVEVLDAFAPAAALGERICPFPREGDLRSRLEAARYLMAPMAGVTDAAYRLMARRAGAGLAYTEMVSVAGIHYGGETGGQKTWELVLPHDPEPDIAVQLFGSKPEQFREAASRVQERLQGRLALIDINMACPVPKVTRKGEGSALLDDPALAAEIVHACVEEADVPVTCKIRRSRKPGPEQAPDFARAMEQAGASAIAVHGRTASQLYRGQADWDAVRHVVEAVDVPVIGSGDVFDAHAASAMRAATGVAAVMVARGSTETRGSSRRRVPWTRGASPYMLAPRSALPRSSATCGCLLRRARTWPGRGASRDGTSRACRTRRSGVTARWRA